MTRPQLLSNGTLFCDWRVNTIDCEDSATFKAIWIAVLVLDIIIFCESFFLISYKLSRGHFRLLQQNSFMNIRGNEGSTVCYALYSIINIPTCVVQIWDIPANQTTKEFMYFFPSMLCYFATIIYSFAMIRTLPSRYWSADNNVHNIYMPHSFCSRTFFGPAVFFGIGFAQLFIHIALGAERDLGNVEDDVILFTFVTEATFVLHLFIVVATIYMFYQFSRITLYLLIESSGVDHETLRKEQIAITRARRIFAVHVYGHTIFFLGNFLLGTDYYVFQNIPLSAFTAFCTILSTPAIAGINYTTETTGFILHTCFKRTVWFTETGSSHSRSTPAPALQKKALSPQFSKDPLDSFMQSTIEIETEKA